MALTYTWKLEGLKKQNSNDLDNIIIGTRWKVTGTDEDGVIGSFIGATPFELNTVDPDNFTPYESLTEEQVLGWIKNIVSGSDSRHNYWNHINERIEAEIYSKRYAVQDITEFNLPWASGSATPTPTPGVPGA
jgi:hypothetical protein